MKLIKCYAGVETEVEYSEEHAKRLIENCPYDKNAKNATFKTADGSKLKVGSKAVVEKIEVQTVFSDEKARKLLSNKTYSELRELYFAETGKHIGNVKKTELIDRLIEKANE